MSLVFDLLRRLLTRRVVLSTCSFSASKCIFHSISPIILANIILCIGLRLRSTCVSRSRCLIFASILLIFTPNLHLRKIDGKLWIVLTLTTRCCICNDHCSRWAILILIQARLKVLIGLWGRIIHHHRILLLFLVSKMCWILLWAQRITYPTYHALLFHLGHTLLRTRLYLRIIDAIWRWLRFWIVFVCRGNERSIWSLIILVLHCDDIFEEFFGG